VSSHDVDLLGTPVVNEQPGFEISGVAGEDMSARQFCIVKAAGWDSATGGLVVVHTGAGEKPIGILQNDPALGEAANIMCEGKSIIRLGAAVALQDSWVSDANGFAVPMHASTGYDNLMEWVGGQFLGAFTLSSTVTGCEMGMVLVECKNPWHNLYGTTHRGGQ